MTLDLLATWKVCEDCDTPADDTLERCPIHDRPLTVINAVTGFEVVK